jgi:large exoprotein involved in heme utilization and adhesion
LDGNDRVDINASGALSGQITFPDLSFITNSLIELPDNLPDADKLIANSCVVPSRQQEGKFIITGSGGLPERPGDIAISPYPTGAVRAVPEGEVSSQTTTNSWKPGSKITEPQGVYQLANGQLVLSRECP